MNARPAHEVSVRQCPGWWPALVQAVCACGWRGPVRDMNNTRDRLLVKFDGNRHFEDLEAER